MLLPVHDGVLLQGREPLIGNAPARSSQTPWKACQRLFGGPLEVKLKTGRTWAGCKPCDRLLGGCLGRGLKVT